MTRREAHARWHATPCAIKTERGAFPYDCVAADKRPDAPVSICGAHNVWWIEEEWGDTDGTVRSPKLRPPTPDAEITCEGFGPQ